MAHAAAAARNVFTRIILCGRPQPCKTCEYNHPVTFEEAERLLISGRYADLLQEALRGQASADLENRAPDFVRWTIVALQACRYIGRTNEALQHAYTALEKAKALNDPALL